MIILHFASLNLKHFDALTQMIEALLLKELVAADQVGGSQAGAKECDEVDCQLVAVGNVEGQVLSRDTTV